MAPLNGHKLQRWDKGDQLAAQDLNGNFAMLYDMAASAMVRAQQPDPAAVGLEMAQERLAKRVAALEHQTAMHAHQRNEKQYVPLSHLGAMVTMVNDLRGEVETAIRRTDQTHAALNVDHDDLHRRLLRVEQHPDTPSKEAFAVLVSDQEDVALELQAALAQIVELRHEVGILRDLALGRDRVANRLEYAPLAYVGELLKRLEVLEARNG
jgi:hypothetical protein